LTRNPIREKENITLSSKRQGIHRNIDRINNQNKIIKARPSKKSAPTKKTNGTPRRTLSAVQHSPIIQTIGNDSSNQQPNNPPQARPSKKSAPTKNQKTTVPNCFLGKIKQNSKPQRIERGSQRPPPTNPKTISNNLTMLPHLKLQDSRCKPTKNKHHWRDDIMISKSIITTKTPTKQHQQTKHMAVLLLFKGPWNVRRIYGYGRMSERTGER
jgi:hypothetical protein